MNTKELIELAMKQQILSDEMIGLLSAFNGIEIECNHSKEMTWAKIYLLGVVMGKQRGIDSALDGFDFAMQVKKLNPEQRAVVKAKMQEALDAQKNR